MLYLAQTYCEPSSAQIVADHGFATMRGMNLNDPNFDVCQEHRRAPWDYARIYESLKGTHWYDGAGEPYPDGCKLFFGLERDDSHGGKWDCWAGPERADTDAWLITQLMELIQFTRSVRPDLQLTIEHVPYQDRGLILSTKTNAANADAVKRHNEAMYPVAKELAYFAPCFYPDDSAVSPAAYIDWMLMVLESIEAWKLNKPIIPLMRMYQDDTRAWVRGSVLRQILNAIAPHVETVCLWLEGQLPWSDDLPWFGQLLAWDRAQTLEREEKS